jgi:hypothetical protein
MWEARHEKRWQGWSEAVAGGDVSEVGRCGGTDRAATDKGVWASVGGAPTRVGQPEVGGSVRKRPVSGLQSIGEFIIQAIQKTVLLLLVSVHFIWSIMRQLSELSDILIHSHGPLLQILGLLLLQFDNPLGNMMFTENNSKFRLVVALGFLMGFHVCNPTSRLQDQKVGVTNRVK